MYKQTHGIAIDSPLGPALANIFLGYCETPLFQINQKTFLYQRYVVDIFATFPNEGKIDEYFAVLNLLHSSPKFATEKDSVLPLLDVKIE